MNLEIYKIDNNLVDSVVLCGKLFDHKRTFLPVTRFNFLIAFSRCRFVSLLHAII